MNVDEVWQAGPAHTHVPKNKCHLYGAMALELWYWLASIDANRVCHGIFNNLRFNRRTLVRLIRSRIARLL